jgi:hypothetical protein
MVNVRFFKKRKRLLLVIRVLTHGHIYVLEATHVPIKRWVQPKIKPHNLFIHCLRPIMDCPPEWAV